MAEQGNFVFLVNPASGGGRGQELLKALRENELPCLRRLAEAAGASDYRSWPVLETTKDDWWKGELEARLRGGLHQGIITIGGDGTLKDVSNILHQQRSKEVALVPIAGGRGNDFIRGLLGYTLNDGSFWDWAERAPRWVKKPVDLGSVNGRTFINMASIGYGGRVVENAQKRNALWSKTSLVYQVEGVIALFENAQTIDCKVRVDGAQVYRGDFFGGFVANGKANGSGLFWTRGAVYDDGKIDGIVFPRPGVLDVARSLAAVKKQSAPTFKHENLQGKEIVLEFDRKVALEIDGDYVGHEQMQVFKCLHQAISVWLPDFRPLK